MASQAATHKPARPHLLHATDLHKQYRMGRTDVHVLRGVDFQIQRGEWVAILGASGSGKSTLLHLLGGLDRPGQGKVLYQGENLFQKSNRELDRYRSKEVGFVFQFYHLLPELTALENVLVGAMVGQSVLQYTGRGPQLEARGRELLAKLQMDHRASHRPNELSGGERQRVAIARALINEPAVLLADEPTGNLDSDTGRQILGVFADLHRAGQTIIMVTHDANVASAADRQVRLESGRLCE